MSYDWVLRVVKNIERYNQNNQLMIASVGMSDGDNTINDCSGHQEYHKYIQEFFNKKLSHYRNGIP